MTKQRSLMEDEIVYGFNLSTIGLYTWRQLTNAVSPPCHPDSLHMGLKFEKNKQTNIYLQIGKC